MAGGLVTEEQYLAALAAKHDIPQVEPDVAMVDTSLLEKVSTRHLWRHDALPFRVADGRLDVILADPLNREFVHQLERI